MTQLLQRLAQPQHRLWLAAALLALLALGVAQAFPLRQARSLEVAQAANASPPAGSLAALLAITADARSLVAEADKARAANAALPLVAGGLQSARPFVLPGGSDLSAAERARLCLALAMYHEAAFEGTGGRRAVAQVVLNRMRHPAFPNTVCAVVFQRSAGNVCQFTFACDGSMLRPRLPGLWNETLAEAAAALAGQVYAPVGMATHYHADYVFPYWAPRLEKIAMVGTHLFYRWPRGWGLRQTFTAQYGGNEPDPAGFAMELAASGLPEIAAPDALAGPNVEAAPYRGESEGGFVDPSKGWFPAIALPAPAGPAQAPPVPTTGER